MFSGLTGGRYVRLSTPTGEFDPHIIDDSNSSKKNIELSTGTAQQLYLALRLAYLETLSDGTGLPVLMDDILVNFDEERRSYAVQLILEFAKKQQVVLFTCHESTVEAFTKVASKGFDRIDLEAR